VASVAIFTFFTVHPLPLFICWPSWVAVQICTKGVPMFSTENVRVNELPIHYKHLSPFSEVFDFGIRKLVSVAALNRHRLLERTFSDAVWRDERVTNIFWLTTFGNFANTICEVWLYSSLSYPADKDHVDDLSKCFASIGHNYRHDDGLSSYRCAIN